MSNETIPKIIIVGKLRSGKSEIARHLKHNHEFEEITFGGMLKFYAVKIFSHDAAGGKPREVYQKFGQACRQVDENVWVKHADFAYRMALDSRATRGIVVSDGRQPNELDWARANGFTVVRVTAPDSVRVERANKAGDKYDEADLTHETELHVDEFEVDYEIENNGTIDELRAKVDELIQEVRVIE